MKSVEPSEDFKKKMKPGKHMKVKVKVKGKMAPSNIAKLFKTLSSDNSE